MFILLMLFWVILNGKITLEILCFGAVFSAVLYWVTCKLCGFSARMDLRGFANVGKFFHFCVMLFCAIVSSNLHVMHQILKPRIDISPSIVTFHVPLRKRFARFFLANSITLTPGTITISTDPDTYCVHALDAHSAEGLDSSSLFTFLKQWEDGCHD
ncbi:MAG: Na+/H+ antiporter subunit E [Oscillospiraceae bacterium]|nr:Na+/H+ antiporter subunit E [Oscillospiraceae bacterium]